VQSAAVIRLNNGHGRFCGLCGGQHAAAERYAHAPTTDLLSEKIGGGSDGRSSRIHAAIHDGECAQSENRAR